MKFQISNFKFQISGISGQRTSAKEKFAWRAMFVHGHKISGIKGNDEGRNQVKVTPNLTSNNLT